MTEINKGFYESFGFEQFEYPLPELSIDVNELLIETTDTYEGSFTVRNTGGAELVGSIHSRAKSITFIPSKWRGNEINVKYIFKASEGGWNPGDIFNTNAVIVSNGGEKNLPITVKLTQMVIQTDEGTVITDVSDFYGYAKNYPAQARRLFVKGDFYMLLLASGYEYADAYELLLKDMNRERALENFFILSGLKNKVTLTLPQKTLTYRKATNDGDKVHDHFDIQRNGDGYVEASISTASGVPWLTLNSERIISSDFDASGAAAVNFTIDPPLIKGRYARERIIISDQSSTEPEKSIEVIFIRQTPLAARLDREAFNFEDTGNIIVTNQSGVELSLDIFCRDSFIKPDAKTCKVIGQKTIAFTVKMSKLQYTQMMFRKHPYVTAEIEVRAIFNKKMVAIILPLTVGEW